MSSGQGVCDEKGGGTIRLWQDHVGSGSHQDILSLGVTYGGSESQQVIQLGWTIEWEDGHLGD